MICALVSYLWYSEINRTDARTLSAQFAAVSNWLQSDHSPPAAPVIVAVTPSVAAPVTRVRAVVQPEREPAARPAKHRGPVRHWPHPPSDMDGLY